ncbi:hypothetical protein Bp8pC_031 [Bacillus phage Bp8p-C]|uniref:Lipoprotein n=2 Tax=Agatevirus Bp8pC TaxID=1910937 RepID=A0A0A0PLF1_9CAUD|nr:hypothetical protein AXJ20_gp031 [Bacillus phage Bp8p-C]YP_009784332.1 hypothetical protein QLX39_gp031 [Bacillus phage Bp8p-T]AHJ87462.1 hypothetical protein Bp8pC_031 [Bacillus phage Bp8p-C]AHJ87673.1 hypothetical protein Bp8pT_031 [Bacillus phage Bp8p-T]
MKRLRMILTLVVLGLVAALAIGCEASSSDKPRNNSAYIYSPSGKKLAEYHGDVDVDYIHSYAVVYIEGKKVKYQNAVVVYEEDK